MLPDVGAGTPLTLPWFWAATILLGYTVISSVVVIMFSRTLKKRDDADREQNDRITSLDEAIREQELRSLERDADHQKEVHQLQMEMLRCQRDCASKTVPREEYLGDFLRIQAETREEIQGLRKELATFVTRVHERVDAAFVGKDVRPK